MCEICQNKNEKLYTNTIHKKGLEPIALKLCFHHDLELFKRGQESFLLKYKHQLSQILRGAMPLESQDIDLSDLKFT